MKDATFLDIWEFLLLPSALDICDIFKFADCEFMNNYKEVKEEYENLKKVIKNRMQKHPNKNKLMDRHKIAAAFAIAIAQSRQFKINKNKCDRLGAFIMDSVLAWNVSVNIIKGFTIAEENASGNKDYAILLEKKGFFYPETSNLGYEIQAIKALYWTIEKNSRYQYGERTGIFFLANIFCLIERYSKSKFIIEAAKTQKNIQDAIKVLNRKM